MLLPHFGSEKILPPLLLLLNSTNHLRRMEKIFQEEETTRNIGLSPIRTRNHNYYGADAGYALTVKLDYSGRVAHTAFGDGFNAGLMAVRHKGIAPKNSAQERHKLANDRHH